MNNNDRKIIPPSQRKTTFQISYALGGIGVGEVTILFIALIFSVLLILLIDIFVGFIISVFILLISLFLVTTDKKSKLKGWEKIIRTSSFFHSKKRFSEKEITNLLFPYKFNDETKEISLSKETYVRFIKIDGKDITKMNYEERSSFLADFSQIIRSTELTLNIYRDIVKPDKKPQIDDWNQRILDIANTTTKEKEVVNSKLIHQIQSYAVEELLKSFSKKFNYYVVVTGKKSLLNEEIKSIIDNCREINLNSFEYDYFKAKTFLKKLFNPYFDEESSEKIAYKNIKIQTEISEKLPKYKEVKKHEQIVFNKNYIKINKNFVKFVGVSKFPLFAIDGWGAICTFDENIIPVFKIFDLNQETAIKNLDLAIQRNDLTTLAKGKNSASKKNELTNINDIFQEIIESITSDNEKVKDLLILFMIKGKTVSELKNNERAFSKSLRKEGIILQTLPHIQFEAFESFLPKKTATLRKELAVEMPCSSIGNSFPIITDDFIDPQGIFLSYTSMGGEIYWNNELRDDYRFNSNTIILGSSGSGKSVTTYKLVLNDVIRGNKVFIIDPEQEYKKLADSLGGKVIDLGGNGTSKINPLKILKTFDESEEGFYFISNHIAFLGAFFETTNSKIEQEIGIIIQRELKELYEHLNITDKEILRNYENISWPIFQDYYEFLIEKSNSFTGRMKQLYDLTILIVSQYADGGVYSNLWNGQQEISFNDNFIVFDTSSLINNKYKIAGQMLFITKVIWSLIQENRKKVDAKLTTKYSCLYIDEAHLLMNKNNIYALEWIQMVTKRIRKYNGKLYLITQNVKDFLGDKEISHYTEGILNNISYSFIGKMQPKDLESLNIMYSSTGGLNNIEKDFIATAGRGKFLLKIGDRLKYFIERVNINPEEAKIFAPDLLKNFDNSYLESFEKLKNELYS